MLKLDGCGGFRSRPPDLHGSSVGEASARQTSHCPQASKDAVWRVTRDSRVKGFSNVAEVMGSLTARGAEAWTSRGIRQQSLAIVGHFFRSGEMVFFVSLQSFELVSRKVYGTERRSTSQYDGRHGVEVPVVNR